MNQKDFPNHFVKNLLFQKPLLVEDQERFYNTFFRTSSFGLKVATEQERFTMN